MGDGYNLTFPKASLTGSEGTAEELSQPDDRNVCDVMYLQAPFLHVEKGLPDTIPEGLRERILVARKLATYGFFCYEFHAVSLFWTVSCIEMALKLKFRELNPGPFRLKRKGKDGAEETCEVFVALLEKRLRERWRIVGMKVKDFDYSFRSFLAWAFSTKLLPDDLPIPVQEIVHGFNNRFALAIFADRAMKDGLIGPNPTLGDLQRCWNGLSEKQRQHYQYKPSAVLIEELPRFRNDMAHPESWNLVLPPRAPLEGYQLLIDIVARLWSSTA